MSARPISREDIEYLVRLKLGLKPAVFSIANPLYEAVSDASMEVLGNDLETFLFSVKYGDGLTLMQANDPKWLCNSFTMKSVCMAREACVITPEMVYPPALAHFGYFRSSTGEYHELLAKIEWVLDGGGVPVPDVDGRPQHDLSWWEPQPTPPPEGGLLKCLRRATLTLAEAQSNSLFWIP